MLYSQKDPAYQNDLIGQSGLTIHHYGCFICSLATLYQTHPRDILRIPGAITTTGLVVSSVIAKALGGSAKTQTSIPPEGWCIAMTKHYASLGYPTHFFCVNPQTKKMMDPLVYPARIAELTYKIDHYRPFTNIYALESDTESLSLSPAAALKRLQNALRRVTGAGRALIERAIERLLRRV